MCDRGPLSSLPEKGQYELNFGKLIDIHKAKSKDKSKFGQSRGERRVQRPWGRKACLRDWKVA